MAENDGTKSNNHVILKLFARGMQLVKLLTQSLDLFRVLLGCMLVSRRVVQEESVVRILSKGSRRCILQL